MPQITIDYSHPVEDAFDVAVGADDYEAGDFAFFEDGEGAGGEFGGGDGAGVGVHGFAGGAGEGGSAFAFQQSSKVAVRDDPGETATFLHRGHA